MTETTRTDPPTTGAELDILRGFLDFHRATLRRKCDGLDAAQLATSHPPSTLTLGRLLAHLAFVEDHWFSVMLHGREPAPPFDVADWESDDDWEMTWASGRDLEGLRGVLDAAVGRSDEAIDAVVARDGLDALAQRRTRTGESFSLRWILVHMIEEYCRHNGHADLVREAIDGAVGE